MTEETSEHVHFALEAWKVSIQVQEHFNTIEMQIRNLAITVFTAVIGASALVYNQSQEAIAKAISEGKPSPPNHMLSLVGVEFSTSDMILFGGMVAWLAFYLMDRWWYHRLLQGAVTHAQFIESSMGQEIRYGDYLGLSNAIRRASPFKLFGLISLHTDTKIDVFYLAVVLVLLVIILFVF